MANTARLVLLERVKQAARKQAFADPTADAFAGALQDMAATQLRSDALKDVGNVGLTALGVGAAGRGLIGLIQHLKATRPRKTRSGPAALPLPMPVQPEKVGAVLPAALKALLQRAGGAVRQGGRDLRLGLGAGPEARELANLQGAVRGSHQALAGGVDDALNVGKNPATLPGGRPDLRAAGAAEDALGHLAANHNPAAVSQMHGRLAELLASQARGKNLVTGGAGAAGLAGGYQLGKSAGFLDGDAATTKSGIPWYGPAMLLGGLGGLGVGWKGMDALIDARRKKQMEGELEQARTQFHDALMAQYDRPAKLAPGLGKAAGDDTMVRVGRAIDALFVKLGAALDREAARPTEKAALDLSNLAGQAVGGYGMYAGLSGLLTGALVYDKINKRSRRAVLEAALKKRQRRRFMQSPTEIYAQPEPVPVPGV